MAFSAPEPGDAPTATDTANGAAAEHRPTPLLAALGAGDAAVAAVAKAFSDAFAAATNRRETVQHRVAELPAELEGLRARFSGDELRRALETYRTQVERAYAQFAGRGEETLGKLREQAQVRQAIARVDEAQEAASRALAAASRQAGVTGEKVAKAGQRFSGRAADAVVDASAATADVVEDAGTTAAEVIEDAGDEAASATRKTTGSGTAAGRTTGPKRTTTNPSSE
jgi:heparin binding hemagglutinin HbhA